MRTFVTGIALITALFGGCRSSIVDDPTTMIQYSIRDDSHVKLTVENSYDTVVATLVDTVQRSGNYTVKLDLSHLPEGMYFYTLQARGVSTSWNYSSTKMFLLKK